MAMAKSALAVVAAIFVTAGAAQEGPMPEEIAWKLLELGRVVDPPNTAALYAPLQQKEPYQGVKVNYRLAPQAMWPAGAEDLADVVQWVSANIAARGGDPARIYLMGHSAG